jgi:aspartate racemase
MTGRVVGILGGMGPEATILLQQRLLASVTARDDSDHLPLLIDMNPQVPSRIAHLIEGTGIDPTPVLVTMARRLEAAGATALAMPCNTAHHYAGAIQSAVSVPLLNMIDLSVAEAAGRLGAGAPLGVLASPAVRKVGVFDAALAGAGIEPLWPSQPDLMLQAIRLIKAQGDTPEPRRLLADAAAELAAKGAKAVLVACSEFSMIADAVPNGVVAIDTVDVLAAAIKAHILNG